MEKNAITPVHPGEMLLEEFLKPMGISQYRLAIHPWQGSMPVSL